MCRLDVMSKRDIDSGEETPNSLRAKRTGKTTSTSDVKSGTQKAAMLYQSASADSLKLSAFTDKDEAFVNTILYGTCTVNTGVIQSLRKIIKKTTLAVDSAVGVKGVTCVLNCLLCICEGDGHCNWEELHLEFVKLLRLCLNFIASLTSSSGTFKSLSSKIINLISISSEKHVLVKSSVVKVLSQPVIDFVLNKNISVIVRRNVVKSFNHVLSQSSRCLRDEVVEAVRGQLSRLPDILLTCGDYDFQTTIMELIFRFISIKANRQSFCSWFNGYPEIQNAFVSTSFKDFDPECRTFLNLVNSSLGSKQLVYTFPCARAFLGETEVYKPKDEHYKEFWVDFNMGSKCVSILCDSSSLTGSTEGNLWEVVNIPCTFVKRAILERGRLGVVTPKVAQSLIMEMGELRRKDIQECLVAVKQIKIIFEQSSGLVSLTEKVLPALFGEAFQNMIAARESQRSSDLKVSGQKHRSLFKRTAKVSTSRVAVVSISNTTLDHLSKYKPLQVTKSPGNCGNRQSQGMLAVRTDTVVCQRAEDVLPAEPTKTDESTVKESADIQDLREILTAHRIENYNRNAHSCIISPQLSHISEEILSQISTVIHESQKYEASIVTGSATLPPISEVKEKFLNIQSDSLDQHNEQCGFGKKGKEMAVRYWETTPVVSCCSKRGEGRYESLDQRMKHTAAHKASMTPSIHLSRIERIENEIVKHKFSSNHQVKSSQTMCIKAGLESSGNHFLTNSGSRESKVVSSIKTPLERPNKLLQRLCNTECNADEKVRAAEGAVFGRPKQLQHKPTELTEVPSSNTLHSTENFLKHKDTNLRSVPESSSSSQEIVLSHGTKEFRDKPQEQTELLDLPSNEQNCLNVVERGHAVVSSVSFRRACSGTNLAEVEVSVSKNNLSHITDSHEGNLVSDINGNTTDESKTSRHMCQEKNEYSAAKSAVRNISDTEEVQQTENSSTTYKGGSRKLHNKHIKHSASENVSGNTPVCQMAERNVSTDEMKNLVHKHCEEDEIPTLKHNAQNDADFVEGKKAKSSGKINRRPKRLYKKQQAELSVSEHSAVNKSDSSAKSESHVRRDVAVRLRRTCKKPQEQTELLNNRVQNNVGCFENSTTASRKNVSEALTRLHEKQQAEMRNCAENSFDMLMKSTAVKSRRFIKKSEEQVYSVKNSAQNDSDFIEGRKTGNSRKTIEGKMRLNSKQQENLGDYAVNSDSLPKPAGKKFELYKKPLEEFKALENTAQSVSDVIEHKKTVSSRKIMEKSPELHRKQQKRLKNCSVIDSESLAEPAVYKSRLLKEREEQIVLSDYESNSHGQGITSMILNQRPKSLIHESEERIECLDSRMSEPLQNEQHTFTKKAVVDKLEKLCQMSGENITNQVQEKNYGNEQIAYTEDDLNGRLKETKNMTVSGRNSSELQQSQEMNVPGSETTCNLRHVLHKTQLDTFPGINSEEQTARSEATSEFSVITTGGRPHKVEKSVGKIHSNNHTSSDCCIIEPSRIDGKDTDVQFSRNNHLLSHSAQTHDISKAGKVASSYDTFSCGLNIQKCGTTASGSSNEAEKQTEKCVQELCVNKKPHNAGLDPAELQQIIHEWDSDTVGDRNDEFSQDVMPQHVEVIKNPSTVKIQPNVKEKDINAVLDNQERSLCDKASGTNEKNTELTMHAKSRKHLESSLVSYAISVELQKVDENMYTSKNEEYEVKKNSESKKTITSGNVHEMDAAKNVKSPCQLKSPCSSSDRGNVQQTQGLRVTKNVPSSEAVVQLSRTLERSSDSSKTPSHKRRLYSSIDSPEVIEFKDCDDISRTSNTLFTPSSRGTKKIVLTNRKSNVNKTPIKKPQDDNKERRKTESVSAFYEQGQLGVTVSSFGGLSQTAELAASTPCHFSIKKFSERWRNKYLEEVRKRKLGKKCKENMQHSVYNSVFSDIETDNDSVLSWLEPEKPKRSEVAQKPEVTYEKRRRTTFRSKEKKKEVVFSDIEIDSDSTLNQLENRNQKLSEIPEKPTVSNEKESRIIVSSRQKKKKVMYSKQPNSQAPFCGAKESIIKSKIRRNKFSKPTNKKHSSPGKKTSRDSSVETFVTRAIEHKLPDLEVLRSNENEQADEAVPVEINILPCCSGASEPDSRILPSLIVEAKHTTRSTVPCVNENEVLNDKGVKERSDEKCLGQVNDSLLSERGEQHVSLNTGSPYSERSLKPQGQVNDSSFSQKDGHLVSPTIGTQYLERSHIPQDQINDVLLSKRSRKAVSTVIGVSYSKRARESLSPCAREFLPASPISGPSVPIEVEAANSPVAFLSQCKRIAQSPRTGVTFREVLPENSLSSQQEDALLHLEYAAEDSAKKSVQSGKGEYKSNKKSSCSDKENIEHAIATKRKKTCKNNTSMNLMAEGSYRHGDSTTVTMKGIAEAGDGGLVLAADDVGRALRATENSIAALESARTVTLKVMNPCTTQVKDFMSGFIQSSAQMIEDKFTQIYRKSSEKRKVLVTDYLQNCESEMEEIKSKIEHLKQQETRWQKLENSIKHLCQLQHNYLNEVSESMSRLSNCHNCFRKQWQKLEEKQQALPLVRADLKQQLHELMAKKFEEESKNDMAALRIRMQSLLS